MVYAIAIIYLYLASVFAVHTYSEITSNNQTINNWQAFGISLTLLWPALLAASIMCVLSSLFRQAQWQMRLLSVAATIGVSAGATQLIYDLV